NLIEEVQYDADRNLEKRILMEYDRAGNLTQQLVFGRSLNGDNRSPGPAKAPHLNQSWHYSYVSGEDGKVRYSLCRYANDYTNASGPLTEVADSTVYVYYPTGSVKIKKAYSNPNLGSKFVNIPDVRVALHDEYGLVRLRFEGSEVYENLFILPGAS